ncbi:MAG: hypothetical protein QOH56_1214 [Pseudonocardiales bacterium]|jgi:hypothetical protein|nr:hypothetical protein [Pseudonocardiales bacterium]MDQ1734963.1 hypothetical protein [Pseudonocardiales bacterium]
MELHALAAAVSQQAADLNVYAGFLFAALDGALPAEYLQVERRSSLAGRLRRREPEVVAVSVRLDENQFSLTRAGVGAPAESTIAHVVNGIVLSRQVVPLAQWSLALAAALQKLAERNAAMATALQRLTSFTV